MSVIEKFDIPFDDLLRLRNSCEDSHFQKEVIDVALQKLAPKAKLGQLLIMRSNTSLALDMTVQCFILDEVQNSSLQELCTIGIPKKCDASIRAVIKNSLDENIYEADLEVLLTSRNSYTSRDDAEPETQSLFDNHIAKKIKEEIDSLSLITVVRWIEKYRESFPVRLVESNLQEKVVAASLNELLRVKSSQIYLNGINSKFTESMNDCILKKVNSASFEELLDQVSYWDDITRNIMKPMLKDHISELTDRLSRSSSYEISAINAGLIVEVVEHLSLNDLKKVLHYFLRNSRNHESYKCCNEFALLFRKHIQYFGSIHPVWNSFLDHLNNLGKQQTSNLKRIINQASHSHP